MSPDFDLGRGQGWGIAVKNYFALPLIALVSGCGGDSGSSSTQATTIPGGPVLPAPTPTQVFTYQSIFDFTKTNRFFSPYVEGSYSRSGTAVATPSVATLNENLRIAFVDIFANPLQVSLTVDRDNFLFRGNSYDYKDADSIALYESHRTISVSRFKNDTRKIRKPEYVAITKESYDYSSNLNSSSRDRFFIFGSETNPDDLFKVEGRLGIYYDSVVVTSIFPADGGTRSSGSLLAFNPIEYQIASNKLSGTFILNQSSYEAGKTPIEIRVSFSGTADLTNNTISGDISSADNAYKGRFFGRFYGPNGTDIGLLFTLNLSDSESIAGTLIGSSSAAR